MKTSATRFLSFITFAAFYNSYINNNIDETVAPVVEDRTILDNIHTHVVSFILHDTSTTYISSEKNREFHTLLQKFYRIWYHLNHD